MKKNDEEEKKEEIMEDKKSKKVSLNQVLQNIISEQMNCTKKMYEARLKEAEKKKDSKIES